MSVDVLPSGLVWKCKWHTFRSSASMWAKHQVSRPSCSLDIALTENIYFGACTTRSWSNELKISKGTYTCPELSLEANIECLCQSVLELCSLQKHDRRTEYKISCEGMSKYTAKKPHWLTIAIEWCVKFVNRNITQQNNFDYDVIITSSQHKWWQIHPVQFKCEI